MAKMIEFNPKGLCSNVGAIGLFLFLFKLTVQAKHDMTRARGIKLAYANQQGEGRGPVLSIL